MARGVIYVMTAPLPGLVKIGMTSSSNFEGRMAHLESNGYRNICSLQRAFAIEVDNYEAKEKMLHQVFARSRISNTEYFSVEVEIVQQLLSSLEGTQIYPKNETKKAVFEKATELISQKPGNGEVPDGRYHMKRYVRRADETFEAYMEVIDGICIIPKGTRVCLSESSGIGSTAKKRRKECVGEDGITFKEARFDKVSPAASFVIGGSIDGWEYWLNEDEEPIDVYRAKGKSFPQVEEDDGANETTEE